MANLSTRELISMARQAGYSVSGAEQLRPNRWLLALEGGAGGALIVLVQARPLIGAVDVQDLADIVRLRRAPQGILLAPGGTFSPEAQRTLAELAGGRLRLCTALPPACASEPGEARAVRATLKPLP